jgi:hypothetical protein
MRDIDRIIGLVKERLPAIQVEQLRVTHPADDDGLRFFSLPGNRKGIQLESSSGMCPFIIEHSDMRETATEALGVSVEFAVEAITDYLSQAATAMEHLKR